MIEMEKHFHSLVANIQLIPINSFLLMFTHEWLHRAVLWRLAVML